MVAFNMALNAIALWALQRVYALTRSNMTNGITHQKQVFTSPTPRLEGKASRAATVRHAGVPFALSELDADELCGFIQAVVGSGDCVAFTLTSDGGALSITVIQGDTRHKAYAATPQEAIDRFTFMSQELY